MIRMNPMQQKSDNNKGKKKTQGITPLKDIAIEKGREPIHLWSHKRKTKLLNKGSYRYFFYTITINTLKSFFQSFNIMVVVQMALAAGAVYLSTYFKLSFDFNVNLFISPIVFPLAFSINADFQRREKVLDDLANFKAAVMVWFFCMRDWKEASSLDKVWMQAVHLKLKSILFHTREYLITKKLLRRKVILRAIYEDFSDINQLVEIVRKSPLPANTSLVARVHLIFNSLFLAFERLRVVREYRSPRSIRSFNKILIFFFPTLISPYCVLLGKTTVNKWSPYYISVLVAFVFSALQGVQDRLDDPFDGMSEDDINLSSIDEWTFNFLEATKDRILTIDSF
ncbi:uncharacterized protein LOC105847310 [Hydra vulgaris]|uniref:uncharacterized protein LOC105847310 n=1 Tax=Hydra vulgaris TaxID=6087 RepID=UPI000640F89C|nr:uncharacterized protein LOC105847310 [Hydra vulgaris]XP_047131083.1 uncharacterized protein LOC105847310 [Hydra vulgaris]